MAISDEERRKRDRERKARQRAAKRGAAPSPAIPRIGLAKAAEGGTESGTQGGTADVPPLASSSTYDEALEALDLLDIPPLTKPLVPPLLRLAQDLDHPLNVPQRASLMTRYLELFDRIVAASKPVERDELDEMRRAFYRGEVPDGSIGSADEVEEPPQRKQKA